MGQELREGVFDSLILAVDENNLQVGGKLMEHLAAYAAGAAHLLPGSGDGDAFEFPMPLADRLEYGGALSAVGGAVSGNVQLGLLDGEPGT